MSTVSAVRRRKPRGTTIAGMTTNQMKRIPLPGTPQRNLPEWTSKFGIPDLEDLADAGYVRFDQRQSGFWRGSLRQRARTEYAAFLKHQGRSIGKDSAHEESTRTRPPIAPRLQLLEELGKGRHGRCVACARRPSG